MPKFSRASEERLATCHRDIQAVLNEIIKYYDFSIVCGFRDQVGQEEAIASGASKLAWPNSKHNRWPSEAVDIAPYPLNWSNTPEFYYLAGLVMATANMLGVKLKWGGRWKDIHDTPHFEIDRGDNAEPSV